MNIISVSQARQNLPKLIDQVDKQLERLFITKNGKTKAVLMSAEDYESWVETLISYEDKEIIRTHKKLKKSINKKNLITEEEMKKRLGLK